MHEILTFSLLWVGSSQFNEGVQEDFYQLGLVFLELILSSFTEDSKGAMKARSYMSMDTRRGGRGGDGDRDEDDDGEGEGEGDKGDIYSPLRLFVGKKGGEVDQSPLSLQDLQRMYEILCLSDFQRLRTFMRCSNLTYCCTVRTVTYCCSVHTVTYCCSSYLLIIHLCNVKCIPHSACLTCICIPSLISSIAEWSDPIKWLENDSGTI